MLLKLDYFPEDFNVSLGSKLTQPNTLCFSLARLLWSAVTVGRASWNKVVQSGMYSAFEIIYRSSILLANLEVSKTKELAQSDAYRNLDPSEKSAVSYFIGLTSAKLLAQKLFGVSWLMHLDVYKQSLRPQVVSGGSRPDLIGLDKSSRWLAFEAKGRTRGADLGAKIKAKGQTKQLVSVKGTPLYLGVGLISYFKSGKLEVYLKDPPIEEPFSPEEAFSLELSSSTFLFDYYKLFVDLINSDYGNRERQNFRGRRYIVKYIEEMDSRIGMDEEVYQNAQVEGRADTLETLGLSLLKDSSEPESPEAPLAAEDGIYIELGQRWISRFVEHR